MKEIRIKTRVRWFAKLLMLLGAREVPAAEPDVMVIALVKERVGETGEARIQGSPRHLGAVERWARSLGWGAEYIIDHGGDTLVIRGGECQ